MKKKIVSGIAATAMMACFVVLLETPNKKVTSLEDLNPGSKVCYCVPAPGAVCFDKITGNILVDYKIVCKEDAEPVFFSQLYTR